MLYFIKKRKIIGKVEDMPPFQYEMYLEDGYKRCDKDGELVTDKDEIADFKAKAESNAKQKAAEKKRLADIKKAEKEKQLDILEKAARVKKAAAKAKADEALRVANLALKKAEKAAK